MPGRARRSIAGAWLKGYAVAKNEYSTSWQRCARACSPEVAAGPFHITERSRRRALKGQPTLTVEKDKRLDALLRSAV